jgi:sugar/nucleoside kinase (ribokinase family)
MGKLFEVYYYDDRPLSKNTEDEMANILINITGGYDLVLVTDFGHGFLSPRLIDLICKKSKFLAVNAQSNTGNYGFNLITKYPRADYVCLDEPEVRLACHSKYGDLGDLLKQLRKKLKCRRIVVTRGHKNTLALGPGGFREVPVFSGKIVDTVGAGDAFFSVTAPCAALDWTTESTAFIGNVIGALAVSIVCNRSSVEPKELFRFITTLLK